MTTPAATTPRANPHFSDTTIPATIKEDISKFAQKSERLANQILKGTSLDHVHYEEPIVIHHYYTPWSYYFYSPFWYQPQPVIVVRNRRDHNDEAIRFLAGVAFAFIGAIAMISIGGACSRLRDAGKELADVKKLRKELDVYHNMNASPDLPYIQEANRLVHLQTRVCRRIRNSALWDLILRVGVAVSSVLAVAGAIALLPGHFISIGAGMATAFAVVMLVKLLMENQQAEIADAREMKKLAPLLQ